MAISGDSGIKLCGACASAGSGVTWWSNSSSTVQCAPSHLAAENDSNGGRADVTTSNRQSKDLQCTNFGFSIPADATIKGIVVRTRIKQGGTTAAVYENKCQLIKGGTAQGDNKANTGQLTNVYVNYDHGSSSDMWSLTLTPTDVNASNFGVALAVYNNSAANRSVYYDYMYIIVYYTTPETKTQLLSAVSTPGSVISKKQTKEKTLSISSSNVSRIIKKVKKTIKGTSSNALIVKASHINKKSLSATSNNVSKVLKKQYRTLKGTSSKTVNLVKKVKKTLKGTSSNLVTLTVRKSAYKTLSVVSHNVITFKFKISKKLKVTSSNVVSIKNKILKTFKGTSGNSVNLIRASSHYKTLIGASTSYATLSTRKIVNLVQKTLTATSSNSTSLIKHRIYPKALNSVSHNVVTFKFKISKILKTTKSPNVNLNNVKSYFRTIKATETPSKVLNRLRTARRTLSKTVTHNQVIKFNYGKLLKGTSTSSVNLFKKVTKKMQTSIAGIASISKGKKQYKQILAGASSRTSISDMFVFGADLHAISAHVVSLSQRMNYFRKLTAVTSPLASVSRETFISRVLGVTESLNATVQPVIKRMPRPTLKGVANGLVTVLPSQRRYKTLHGQANNQIQLKSMMTRRINLIKSVSVISIIKNKVGKLFKYEQVSIPQLTNKRSVYRTLNETFIMNPHMSNFARHSKSIGASIQWRMSVATGIAKRLSVQATGHSLIGKDFVIMVSHYLFRVPMTKTLNVSVPMQQTIEVKVPMTRTEIIKVPLTKTKEFAVNLTKTLRARIRRVRL